MIPLLACGACADDLQFPLSTFYALDLTDESQALRMVHDVAEVLHIQPAQGFAIIDQINILRGFARVVSGSELSEQSIDLLVSALPPGGNGEILVQKILSGTSFGVNSAAPFLDYGSELNSLYEDALNQLQELKAIVLVSENGGSRLFRLTGKGHEIARGLSNP